MQRIDAHHHFWQLSRGDYHWLTRDLKALYRDFLPSDLEPHFSHGGVSQSILIQAAESVEETHFMLNLAEENSYIFGVVGWVNMEHPAAPGMLRELAKHPKFIGIRPMIQNIEDRYWMLKPELGEVYRTLIELNLSFDALVKPPHLSVLLRLLQQYPELKLVIDHGGKPDLKTGDNQEWFVEIEKIASQTQAYCKVSGLVTEAGKNPTTTRLKPYFQHLLSCFGAERLMWGSDWPVVNLTADYTRWLNITGNLLSDLSKSDRQAIWANTAKKFYGMEHTFKVNK